MKITFLDGNTLHSDVSWKEIEKLGKLKIYATTAKEDILKRSIDSDILIVNKTHLGKEEIEKLEKTKLICVAAAGFDCVDIEAARNKNIPVCNAPGYGNNAIAQMAMAHILNAMNQVSLYANLTKKGKWKTSQKNCFCNTPLLELTNKKVAIIGLGRIGYTLAKMLQAFGAKIYAVTSKTQEELNNNIKKIELKEAFRICDIVSLNCPLCNNTIEFINKKLLNKCNPELILVNTARGKLINEGDLYEALKTKRLKAYCADVMYEEPPSETNPLLNLPNVFITPHIAWATNQSRQNIINILSKNIEAFLQGERLNIVN